MSSRPAPTPISCRVRLACTGLLVAAALVTAAPGAAAQTGEPTEPSVPELIVPGDPGATSVPPATGGAGGLEPAPPTTSGADGQETDAGSGGDGLSASTKVWIIIGGLVGIALVVFVLTILYWRRTRPALLPREPEADVEPKPAPDEVRVEAAAPSPPTERPDASVVPGEPAESEREVPVADPDPSGPRPVGDQPPTDPRRSVYAPPPEAPASDEEPPPPGAAP